MAYGGTKAGTSGKYSQSGMQGKSVITSSSMGNRVFWCAGGPGAATTVDYVHISNIGANATDFHELVVSRENGHAAVSDGNRALIMGGYDGSGFLNDIDYKSIMTAGDALDFGDQLGTRYQHSACSDGVRVVSFCSGAPMGTVMEYGTIARLGDTASFGDNFVTKGRSGGSSDGSRGLALGGAWPGTPGYLTPIEYFPVGRLGGSSDFGDLSAARGYVKSVSDGNKCFTTGGHPGPGSTIDFVIFQTLGNAVDWGETIASKASVAGGSNGSRAVWAGGDSATDDIQYFNMSIASGSAVDWGGERTASRGDASAAAGGGM